MIIGIPAETYPGERRVAMVPAALPALTKAGWAVVVQRGAGTGAGAPDAAYLEQGARVVAEREEVFAAADLVVQVLGPGANPATGAADLALLRHGQALVGFLRPLAAPDVVRALAATGATAFAVELLPRITRAQSMDALSSMATIAGYKAVLVAAAALPRLFPMMMTAAGTVTAAKVLVIGAGVAGLQAIATARRLGAVVAAYDVRPAVKEQVQSLGARFVELPLETAEAEDAGGYARAQDESFYRRQQALLEAVVAESDVVITTAVVPGARAPVLIPADTVARMRPGSVVVDLAAERGGNCALTEPGAVVERHGVAVHGPINLAGTVPHDASRMYARNLAAFAVHLLRDGALALDADDPIVRETMITRDGAVVHPRVRDALA